MSRLNTLIKNRERATEGLYTTHSSYICACIGIFTDTPFYKILEHFPHIRARPTLLAVMRNLIAKKEWEVVDVTINDLSE